MLKSAVSHYIDRIVDGRGLRQRVITQPRPIAEVIAFYARQTCTFAGMEASMKCLRIYSTADGESHFDEVDIPTNSRQVHPNAAVFEVSARYATTHISFTRIPAGARQVDWHTVPGRVLTVRLDGSAEYQTSDGDQRHVPAGSFILFEDTHGKGHKTEHSPEEQTVIWINLPRGLDPP